MKKLVVIFLAVFCMATAFAQGTEKPPFRVSVGGGAFVGGSFSYWSVDKDMPGDLDRYNTSHFNVGPFLFVDLKYAEISLGFPLGFLNADDTMSENPNFPARTFALRGSAYLKYPFTFSPAFSLFPLLGVDYDLYILAKRDDDRDAKFPVSAGNQNADPIDALNSLWFKTGVGFDVSLSNHLFLRTEFLYGLRLPNEMEKYLKDTRNDVNWMINHGGDLKVSLGYRF